MKERGDTNISRRHNVREAVLRTAQIVCRGSIIDCILINISSKGARVRTAAMVQLPDRVTLRVRGGAVFPSVRRWARGLEVGLAFVELPSISEQHAHEIRTIYASFLGEGIKEALQRLRGVDFFGDLSLKEIAEHAEQAHASLGAALKARTAANP
jgi:hypothetical protein